jgi:ATP-dependent DNA helicase RecG
MASYKFTALGDWPHIELVDDHDGCLFTARILRPALEAGADIPTQNTDIPTFSPTQEGNIPTLIPTEPEKMSEKILLLIKKDSEITIPQLAALLEVTSRTVERNLSTLQRAGVLRRIGSRKTGRWEGLEVEREAPARGKKGLRSSQS